MSSVEPYIALAMQLSCNAVNALESHEEVLQQIDKQLDQLDYQIFSAIKFLGKGVKLIVVPEYFMTSYPGRENIQDWRSKACLEKTSPVFKKLSKMCITHQIYFSGNYYEADPNFPDLFFQSSFIIDDDGKLILNYRRLNSMYSPTPFDVYDKYLELYGYESLFPVVDTKLGKLACIASEEILYPEVARCLMMRGAEVFLHSSSEIGSTLLTKKNIAKRARAIENMAYVVSANSAGIKNIGILENSTDGASQVVHYEGHVLAEASTGESIVAHNYIHINALRHYRSQVSMKNYIARQRFGLYAKSYSDHEHYPSNLFLKGEINKARFLEIQKETIKILKEKSTI